MKNAAGKAEPAINPEAKPPKGVFAASSTEELGKILTPVLAAAGSVIKPDSFIGKKLLNMATGFHVAEEANAVNKLGPGAATILLPEPLGAVPEHFFMEKPHVPGTKIYLDPLYNYERYEKQKMDRLRIEAAQAQLDTLKPILPQLSSQQLAGILNNSTVRRQYLGFIESQQLTDLLLAELAQRKAAEKDAPDVRAALAAHHASHDARVAAEATASFLAGDVYNFLALVGYLENQGIATRRESRRPLDPFATPIRGGTIVVELIPALTGAAQRNQDAAQGINRELVTERVDP